MALSFFVMRSIMHSTLMEEKKRLEEMKKYKNYILNLIISNNLISK